MWNNLDTNHDSKAIITQVHTWIAQPLTRLYQNLNLLPHFSFLALRQQYFTCTYFIHLNPATISRWRLTHSSLTKQAKLVTRTKPHDARHGSHYEDLIFSYHSQLSEPPENTRRSTTRKGANQQRHLSKGNYIIAHTHETLWGNISFRTLVLLENLLVKRIRFSSFN